MKTFYRKELSRKEIYGIRGLWFFIYLFFSFTFFKSTLMKISKSHYMFVVFKTLLWKFCIPYPHNSRVITHEICIFLKKFAYLLTYSIVSVCLLTNISFFKNVHIWKTKNDYSLKPSTYFLFESNYIDRFGNLH